MAPTDEGHLRLAYSAARRFCRRCEFKLCAADRDDIRQEACLALLRAARCFDPTHPKANWSSLTSRRIQGALLTWLHRRPLVHPPDRLKDQSALSPSNLSCEELPQRKCVESVFVEELRLALERLSPSQRELLTERFGLDGRGKRTLEELGGRDGVTKEAMRIREKKALARLQVLTGNP